MASVAQGSRTRRRALALASTGAILAGSALAGAAAGDEHQPGPPALTLAGPGPQPVPVAAARAKLTVTATCSLDCAARAGGEVEVRRRRRPAFTLRLRPARLELAAGQEGRLRLRARARQTRRLKRALGRRGTRALATVTVVAAGDGGSTEAATAIALRPGFALLRREVAPRRAFLDGRRPVALRARFQGPGPTDLRATVERVATGRVVRKWTLRGAPPWRVHRVRWRGFTRKGRAAPDGRYRWRVGRRGGHLRRAGVVDLRGHAFPVAGPHGRRGAVGEFGAARVGGRVHEGFDVTAPCGTKLVAAQGGRVRRVADDPRLKGHFVVIRGSGTRDDYLYAHLPRPSPLRAGDRVRTGDRVGEVGRSGNAASTPCHLHFEIWPEGHGRGLPLDPGPLLQRWDRWS